MGRHSDIRTLIQRGRKAGLNTRELYAALASRSEETGDQTPEAADCNGFVPGQNAAGQRIFQPLGTRRRS